MSTVNEIEGYPLIVRAIAPWFGGKRTLASRIAPELGKHTQYFEPFCGSMAVLFAKEQSQKETVNDLHGDLINLARVLQDIDLAENLYDRLNHALFSEDLLQKAKWALEQELIPGSDVYPDRAFWYFLASWGGRNGTAGTARLDYQLAVRWTKNGGSPTVRFKHAVESIPAWHYRLKNVVILNRDSFRILDRFEDCEGTVIYADPPYPAETRSKGAIKNGRGGKYLHEFEHGENHVYQQSMLFPNEDRCEICGKRKRQHYGHHEQLAKVLNTYKHARIIVSSYDGPLIRRLYKDWTFIDCTMNKQLHAQNGRGARKKVAPEVLIINGPSLTK